MPNYTQYLNLEKPLQDEQYNVDVFNANSDKIDEFARTTPSLALSANVLTSGANINGVNFKGNKDIVTGLGLYSNTTEYNETNVVYLYDSEEKFRVYKSLQNQNTGNNPIVSPTFWMEVELGGSKGAAREIGEIVTSSIPIVDSGLHLLDGTRLFGDGVYADFVNYIKELYENNPNANYFTDETTWQNQQAITGSCGKYVYDANLNSVRLPKIGNSIIQGTALAAELGELIEAGLPSITHTHSGTTNYNGNHSHTTNTTGKHNHEGNTLNATGKFYSRANNNSGYWGTIMGTNHDSETNPKGVFTATQRKKAGSSYAINSSVFNNTANEYRDEVSFSTSGKWSGKTSTAGDHSHSTDNTGNHNHTYITSNNTAVSNIFGKSNTVQPQTIKMFVYVVIATSQKTNIEIDIDNIATDLNNKVNVDFSNVTWTDDMKDIVYNVIEDGISKEAATSEIIGMVKPDGITTQVDSSGTLSTVLNPNNYYTKSQVDGMISTVYKYKGSVYSYEDLPNNASIGDVYLVTSSGDSYVWNGEDWDMLSTTIDLTPYATTENVNDLINEKEVEISNLSAYILELQNRVSELERIIDGGNA